MANFLDKTGLTEFATKFKEKIVALIPTKTSELTNDSGFIDKNTTELTNYIDNTRYDADNTSIINAINERLTVDNIIAGDNITLTKDGNNVTINSEGSSATVPTTISVSTKTLKSGFSTTATTVDFTGYIGVYIRVLPSSGGAYVPLFIPANLITTTATSYQGADESNWVSVSLQKSGDNIIILGKGRSVSTGNYAVYGVKLTLN